MPDPATATLAHTFEGSLLRQGNVRAAQEYRERLDTLAGDVRNHLSLASRVLADLRPRGQRADAATHPAT